MFNFVQPSTYARLSVVAALVTIVVKSVAFWMTDSVSLLSDALESGINLVAAILVLQTLRYAARPPDSDHMYGHEKAQFFAAAVEGTLILAAAMGILTAAFSRFFHPSPIMQIDLGIILSGAAGFINLLVGLILLSAAKQFHAPALKADGQHLLTDFYTSIGVIGGLLLMQLTEATWIDPVVAALLGLLITVTGIRLIRESVDGLMDKAIHKEQIVTIEQILQSYALQKVDYHALRTRQSAGSCFISLHLLVPGVWTVQRGHDLADEVEHRIKAHIPKANVFTHIEPVDDPSSFDDIDLQPH